MKIFGIEVKWLKAEKIEEEGICPTCKGRAKWMERHTEEDGTVTEQWHYCEDCDGTGYISGDGDVD